ncbi:MAG: putative sugar O-methyltransferase [Oscillatoriales cyanobacterium]|uniref:Sugar O-methyltransferase n=1 Tax=Microcoleus anatoxicus PTRS2 TaxID=2705321 RepID=A0ABU8YN49_9CYAN|nr:MAG: putative sugar O-methyltransferase [Oscillatoriales cyanobacterium]TAE04783.1 MAG: putative sugar O-methyltransferase [Oscillatoriales cyanobacterium]
MQNPKSAIGTRMVDNLISLCEALGVIQYENPEQGRYGINVYENIDRVVSKLEQKLGVPIGKPKVFGLHGIKNGDRVIDMRASQHLWAAWRMREIVGLNKNICEIGGGFGGCCYYSHLLGAKSYTIIDLPIINVVSAYFLMKCFGEEAVQLFGEESCDKPIKIMPSCHFMMETNNFDLCFNQDSFPELPMGTVGEYLSRIPEVTRSYFYHINQEGCAITHENLAQLNINKIMAEMSSYKLLYRYPNWIRKGYVEELYSLVAL